MHQIINQIIESTRTRIPDDSKKKRIIPRDFKKTIENRKKKNLIPVISEIKPSSPKRSIRKVAPEDAADIAIKMEAADSAAISILTEPVFFKGSMENLLSARNSVRIPVLRKDFIIHKNQIHEIESDLILLIAGILKNELDYFVNEALSSGRETIVEVHNAKELDKALSTGTHIIGINNRDLTTMKIDLSTTLSLAPLISNRIIISESGISCPEDAIRMIDAGSDAILVGTSIMQGDVYEKTYELVHAMEEKDE